MMFNLKTLARAIRKTHDCTMVIEHIRRMRQISDARSILYDSSYGGSIRFITCRGCRS